MTYIQEDYYDWLCYIIELKDAPYKNVIALLHSIEFEWTVLRDENRAKDGESLRYDFVQANYGCDNDISAALNELNCKPCSVLEMMIALAIRCEIHIMSDPEYGDRTAQWFWLMMNNLGLISMTDDTFDNQQATIIISRFLNRRYKTDGTGGLFAIPGTSHNMRSAEIWYQLCWAMQENN